MAIVGAFAGTGANEKEFVFTLTQDLLIERVFTNGSHVLFDIWILGINNFGCFNYTLPKIQTEDYRYVLPGQEKFQSYNPTFGMLKLTVDPLGLVSSPTVSTAG